MAHGGTRRHTRRLARKAVGKAPEIWRQMVKGTAGRTFNMTADNAPMPGCTVSTCMNEAGEPALICFSLAAGTDISPEMHPADKLLFCHFGQLRVFDLDGREQHLRAGACSIMRRGVATGVESADGCVYTEIELEKGSVMNELLEAGKAVQLGGLLDYKADSIVNLDIVKNDHLKFMVMAFDEGTGLSEHAAPGEAIVCALEGRGIIGYEGAEHAISAGESFKFDKGGKHYVKADGRFKMALLIVYSE